jgi:hypothetical protein
MNLWPYGPHLLHRIAADSRDVYCKEKTRENKPRHQPYRYQPILACLLYICTVSPTLRTYFCVLGFCCVRLETGSCAVGFYKRVARDAQVSLKLARSLGERPQRCTRMAVAQRDSRVARPGPRENLPKAARSVALAWSLRDPIPRLSSSPSTIPRRPAKDWMNRKTSFPLPLRRPSQNRLRALCT